MSSSKVALVCCSGKMSKTPTEMEAICLKSSLEAVTQLCREEMNKKEQRLEMIKQLRNNNNNDVEAITRAQGLMTQGAKMSSVKTVQPPTKEYNHLKINSLTKPSIRTF